MSNAAMNGPATADVIVIGMGPAGESVAGQLAEAGLDVIGIDRALVGGECPYWGCVPSKMMLRAAHLLAEARRIPGLAGTVEVAPDWSPVAERIRTEATSDWDDTAAVERFEAKGGRFLRGEARIVGPATVAVEGRQLAARRGIVVATGTRPSVPPIEGLEGTPYWTNHDVVEATQLPRSTIVLGGGAVGAELAQVHARFGVDVVIIETEGRLLPMEEPEAGVLLGDVLGAEGIEVRTGASAVLVGHADGRFSVELEDGSVLDAEALVVATGRRTELAGLGVGALGLDDSAPTLGVDRNLRVVDGVWAVGDVTGEGAFTHVATYQADLAVADILGRDHPPASYHALPRVTFTDPEIGAVGATEADAVAQGTAVTTSLVQVPHTARGWIHAAGNEGIIKLVADRDTGTLVGATVAGPNGGEVLGLLALAVHARTPVSELRTMIWAYPTFHRGIEDAVRALDL